MSILGDLVGSFTGSTAKRAANDVYQSSTRVLQEGRDRGLDALNQGYTQARGYLDPYAQSGTQANNLYGTYLGLNGADAQRSALAGYAGADPFRQYNEDMANKGLARQFNRMGMLDSGNFRMAAARANLERGSQDYNNYLARLAGLSQQGAGAAGQLGNFAMNNGQGVAGLWNGYGQNQAGNEIQHGNALAQASGIFGNNLMKLGGLGVALMTGNPGMSLGFGGSLGQKGGSNYYGG